jgi:SAM-dependent methyltransferase
MSESALERRFIEAMAKHLPPSGATLHVLDVGGGAFTILAEQRADLAVTVVDGGLEESKFDADSFDAIVAYDEDIGGGFLKAALAALRPGGRLVVVQPLEEVREALVKTLERAGYTRILVEPALDDPPTGVLLRGEKPHTEAHTLDRVRQVAGRDVATRAGRYIHLLIQQKPNKPPWSLKPGEKVEWHAIAVQGKDETVLLAFSSLPKAVEFMQPALLDGFITDVNKIAKFRWEQARAWPFPVLVNPTDDILATHAVVLLPVDPATAEAPDE